MKLSNLVLPLALLLGACGGSEGSSTGVQASDAKGLVNQAKDKASSMLADFQKSSEEKLASVDTTLESLKQKAAAAAEENKPELEKLAADLGEKKAAVMAKLAELKDASGEKLSGLMKEIEPKITELVQSAKDALAKLKE
ncbi:MAG: hypothetical protein IPJ19_06855 [Planctomycetes bacterium]|nr:hypothetical protein [Planctomycetota bacterium]